MNDADVRERPGRAHCPGGPPFDLVRSKLRLAMPARRQGRIATLRRWFGWLDDQQGIERNAMVTVLAALIYAWMGR